MNLAFEGKVVLIMILGIMILITALIVFLKNHYNKLDAEDVRSRHKEDSPDAKVRDRVKYPEVDVFRWTGTFWGLGLAVALLFIILAFSWTAYDAEVDIPDDALELEEEIEIEPPRTAEPPPPPPPPPPPVIEEVPEEEIEEEEEVTFTDQSITEETVVEAPPEPKEAPPPPPPPPEPEPQEIFKVVEQMPRFPGCEDISGSEAEKKKCADKKMLEFIYKNIDYPAIARENGVEGTVVVRFVVDEKGNVTQPELLRDIGARCGEEALRVVKKMNEMPQKWTPGKQRGRPVKVYFNLPVKFRLE